MEIVEKFLNLVLSVLPRSPFVKYIAAMEEIPFLQYLNWFIPIGTFILIGEAWLVAIGIFYLYSIILRWIRAIE